MKNSAFLRLDVADVTRGLAVVVIAVVLGAFQQAVTAHGFDFAAYDWAMILDVSWKASIAYLGKNLLSKENGKVLGTIG